MRLFRANEHQITMRNSRKKIAFIVEPHFMVHHVGVRNYIFSLYSLLSKNHDVDFVSSYPSAIGRTHWYRAIPKDPAEILRNEKSEDGVLQGTPKSIGRRIAFHDFHAKQITPDDFHHSHIGSDLSVEDYDIGIVTNPWLVHFEGRLPCQRLVGMVYDTVPNEYVFTRSDKPYSFASLHQRGFSYYRQHCDAVVAISEKAARDFSSLVKVDSERVRWLPPVLPPAYEDVPTASNSREGCVVLASPFDKRKGLAVMPNILNTAKDKIQKLFIYGGIRCSRGELKQFFQDLKVDNVEWYPNATAKKVKDLFSQSKVLLFPSFDEGLGLPILEAQFCGCRAMVRDKQPMNQLIGMGSRFVTGQDTEDGKTLESMLRESFDHQALQEWALEEFCSRHVERVLEEVLAIEQTHVSPREWHVA